MRSEAGQVTDYGSLSKEEYKALEKSGTAHLLGTTAYDLFMSGQVPAAQAVRAAYSALAGGGRAAPQESGAVPPSVIDELMRRLSPAAADSARS